MNKCFSGYLSDSAEVLNSASGGCAYAIAHEYISNGGIVYGVGFKTDFSGTAWLRCTCEEELQEFRGTKYVKAEAKIRDTGNLVYSSVIKDITDGKEVAFFGLPCEVGVLIQKARQQGINTKKLLTIDLICQGPATPHLFNDFLELKKNEYKSDPVSINMRYKKPDWKHPHFRIIFKNGSEYCVPLQQTEFWSGCVNMPMSSCSRCRFKGDNHLADITIGDHWGLNEHESFYNINGTSIVLVHTLKGLDCINRLDKFIKVAYSWDDAIVSNPRYESSVVIDKKKIRYQKIYKAHGLQYAHLHRMTIKEKIKGKIKKIWRH